MTNEEFLRDVFPNHTDKSLLELHKELLRLHNVGRSVSKVIDIETKVQMTKREWRQVYRKGWHIMTIGGANGG